MSGRTIFRGVCTLGLLALIVTMVAPVAYGGEGLLNGTEPPPVDTSTVTEVAETVPEVPDVSEATEPVTEAVPDVSATAETVTEVTEPVTESAGTKVADAASDATSPAGSTTSASSAPASSDASVSTGTTGGASGTDGTSTPSSSGATSAEPGVSAGSPQQGLSMSFASASGALHRAPTKFNAAARENPEDVLDELLGIGNSVGVDEVRGLQITNAEGDAADVAAPSSSGASTPAPLALTGIAIGAFLVLGLCLVVAGNGARSAGDVSAA